MGIKENIKSKRAERQMTLEELAKQVGVSRQTIQRYESGVISNIPSDKIELIADALNTTPAYLMGWTDSDTDNENHKVYADIKAHSHDEAIYIAVKNMLLANGDFQKASTITENEAVDLYNRAGFESIQTTQQPTTLAAHFDGEEYTESELEEIKNFAEYVKTKRKQS